MVAVQRGRRPLYPPHEFSRIRGLNNKIWDLIGDCWTTEPSERPCAGSIVDRMLTLPNRPADKRPLDSFNISLPFRVLRDQINQPFSTLGTDDFNLMKI